MYDHVQRSPVNILLYLPAIFAFLVVWQIQDQTLPSVVVAILGLVLLFLALSVQTLRVSDAGEYLDVRFGPLNLFGTRILYSEITAVERSKSSLIDGWGIHFIPFRGWTLNLWGFECAKITRGKKVIRIGTDDSENLVAFLREQLANRSQPANAAETASS